jgi:hypothetical protein
MVSGGKEPDAVCMAYVHANDYAASWGESRMNMIAYDLAGSQRLLRGGYINMRCGTDGLPEARNRTVRQFLEAKGLEGQEVPLLMWTDTDMGYKPDSVERLAQLIDPVERPIVGGLCFTQREYAQDGYGGHLTYARPTLLDWVLLNEDDEKPTFTARDWYPPDTLVKVAGTGAAFVMVHRIVFEKMRAEYGETWYEKIRGDDGVYLGEDISFCIRANALGFPIYVHTGIKTTHMKNVWVSEDIFWDQQVAPPATEPVQVLWDGLRRWDEAPQELQESLRASTGLASTRNDTPWIFVGSANSRFGPGWLDHAVLAATKGYAVVGTGGGVLVSRAYVDEQGASWDGPRSLLHDGYNSTVGALNEVLELARRRDTYVEAKASKVEMTEPPVIDKFDKRLFESRARKHLQ